jgi:glutathione S-transferase
MRLYQIPFSHNCIKVRHVLDLEGIDHAVVNINPAPRGEVKRVSGQTLVPTLVDRGHVVSGSTPILLYLEEQRPEPAFATAKTRSSHGAPPGWPWTGWSERTIWSGTGCRSPTSPSPR